MHQRRTVVVTGMGAISPLGVSVAQLAAGVAAGRSGLGRITHFNPDAYACQVAGQVPEFDPALTGLEAKDLKRCDRFIQLGLVAVREAMAQAGLQNSKQLPETVRQRIGVVLGTGIGGLPAIESATQLIAERGPSRVSPFYIPAMLPNMLAGQVSILYGLQGPNVCPVSACATSAHALGWAKRLIEWGEADVVVAGGAEATICPTAVAGFGAMRALSTGFNENPTAASRPFDAARDGFVMGEGGAALVLESAEHAAARGATPLAVLSGFGQTADASHMTLADGQGSRRAMQLALTDANLTANQIAYINAHATSTPAGDELEAAGIAAVFGASVPVSSTKSLTGHLLGAAGALEAIISITALRGGQLPPSVNAPNPAAAQGIQLVPAQGGALVGNAVLSNSFGFGGTNASLIFSRA